MPSGIEIVAYVILGLIGIGIVLYILAIYNGFIRLKNNIEKSWANINVILKQRSNEVPKLVKTIKGYMKYERKVLNEITKARTFYTGAKTVGQKAKADNMMTEALKSIFAVAENYPKLQAQDSFKQLQQRISGLENELADRREFYNDNVNNYNIRLESIPDRFVASMIKLKRKEMFQVAEEDKKDVEIDL